MIASKHIEKIVAVIVALAVVFCMLAAVFSDNIIETFGDSGLSQQYESEIFDTSEIISLNIIMDDEEWNEMLENAISEEYYQCDVEVNGTTFYNVGIRPKGNTSLSTIVNDPDTNRYSFKLEFDKYVDGQTCFGLDKLVLNNNYADAANMKEAIVYDMFRFLGADAALYNYADISVNGETWGIYLALEAVEDSFMLRNYGVSSGNLYKPDSMNFGGAGGMKNMDKDELQEIAEQFFGNSEETTQSDSTESTTRQQKPQRQQGGEMPDMGGGRGGFGGGMPQMGEMPSMPADGNMPQMPEGMENFRLPEDMENFTPPEGMEMPDMGGGRGGFGSGGGSALNYTDDSLDSYSSIWEGEVNSTGDSDHKRVVEALKNISEQNDVEKYLDVDNMIKYMAVHTFAVNLDSLSGSMTHNYYLYEENGKLNLLPWDYNLAFGGFSQGRSGSGATSTINFPIDTPFSSGISLEDRQIFAAILENEEYLEEYHECLRILCDEYVNGGGFEESYSRIRKQIDTLVQNDPNAFYTYEEYNEAAELLCEVISLRAESIKGQLDGTIPSTNEGQNTDSSALVDGSHIDLSVLGTMNMGGGPDKSFRNNTDSSNGNPFSPGMPDAAAPNAPPSSDGNLQSVTDGSESIPQGMMPFDFAKQSGSDSAAEKPVVSSSADSASELH